MLRPEHFPSLVEHLLEKGLGLLEPALPPVDCRQHVQALERVGMRGTNHAAKHVRITAIQPLRVGELSLELVQVRQLRRRGQRQRMLCALDPTPQIQRTLQMDCASG